MYHLTAASMYFSSLPCRLTKVSDVTEDQELASVRPCLVGVCQFDAVFRGSYLMPGPPNIDIRDISFKLRYIMCVSQLFSRIYARFGNSPCTYVCGRESLSSCVGYWQKYRCKKYHVWYRRPRRRLVALPRKKVVYMIILQWNIIPWLNLDQFATQHLSHCKLHRLACGSCVRSHLIHQFICVLLWILLIMWYSTCTLAEGHKKKLHYE